MAVLGALSHCGVVDVSMYHYGVVALGHGMVALYYCIIVELRHRGIVALWHCGVVALWRCGTVALWHFGVVALWRCDVTTFLFPAFYNSGSLEFWNSLPILVHPINCPRIMM